MEQGPRATSRARGNAGDKVRGQAESGEPSHHHTRTDTQRSRPSPTTLNGFTAFAGRCWWLGCLWISFSLGSTSFNSTSQLRRAWGTPRQSRSCNASFTSHTKKHKAAGPQAVPSTPRPPPFLGGPSPRMTSLCQLAAGRPLGTAPAPLLHPPTHTHNTTQPSCGPGRPLLPPFSSIFEAGPHRG